ncbi:DUF2066 domain-containing protein [bacterium]|nr:DUF2066 domain-containing protein [bacterium]
MEIRAICSKIWHCAAFALLALAFLAHSALAWDAYTAQKVEGFAQGANATEARAKAMEQAEKKAFEKIASQLQLGDPGKFSNLSSDQISRMVSGYEVVEEQPGQGTYRTVVHITFSPAQIRAVTGVTPRPIAPPPEVVAAEAEAKAKRAADAAQKAAQTANDAMPNDKAKADMAASVAEEAKKMNEPGTPLARATEAAKAELAKKGPANEIPTPSGTPILQASQLTKLEPVHKVKDVKDNGPVPSQPAPFEESHSLSSMEDTMQKLAAPKAPPPPPPPPTPESARRMGVLLLPVLHAGDQALLWEDTNAWRAAWQRQPLASSRPALILPYGDADDVAQLDLGQIERGDRSGLRLLSARYGASEALLMDATLVRLSAGNQLQVKLIPLDMGVTPRMAAAQFAVSSAEHPGKLMDMAVVDSLKRMSQPGSLVKMAEAAAKRASVAPAPTPGASGQPEKIKVVVPLTSMLQWVRIRQGLESMPEVGRVEIIAMSPSQADIWVDLKTSANQFSQALGARGYECLPREGYWILKPETAASR